MAYVSSIEEICIEKGIQQGIQQGVQQGLQQGMQAGEAIALQRLLTKRFGPLANVLTTTLEKASLQQIEIWFDLAITAPSLDAVFAAADR